MGGTAAEKIPASGCGMSLLRHWKNQFRGGDGGHTCLVKQNFPRSMSVELGGLEKTIIRNVVLAPLPQSHIPSLQNRKKCLSEQKLFDLENLKRWEKELKMDAPKPKEQSFLEEENLQKSTFRDPSQKKTLESIVKEIRKKLKMNYSQHLEIVCSMEDFTLNREKTLNSGWASFPQSTSGQLELKFSVQLLNQLEDAVGDWKKEFYLETINYQDRRKNASPDLKSSGFSFKSIFKKNRISISVEIARKELREIKVKLTLLQKVEWILQRIFQNAYLHLKDQPVALTLAKDREQKFCQWILNEIEMPESVLSLGKLKGLEEGGSQKYLSGRIQELQDGIKEEEGWLKRGSSEEASGKKRSFWKLAFVHKIASAFKVFGEFIRGIKIIVKNAAQQIRRKV